MYSDLHQTLNYFDCLIKKKLTLLEKDFGSEVNKFKPLLYNT